MAIDRNKVRTVLSVVALSLAFGFNAEYMVEGITVPQAEAVVKEVSSKKFSLKIKKEGAVSEQAAVRVKDILSNQLTNEAYDQLCKDGEVVLVDAKNLASYIQKNGITGKNNIAVGDKVNSNTGIKMLVVENYIEDMVPSLAKVYQQYYNQTICGV